MHTFKKKKSNFGPQGPQNAALHQRYSPSNKVFSIDTKTANKQEVFLNLDS